MTDSIEVRVGGRGMVRGDDTVVDISARAMCSLCGVEAEAVASVTPRGATATYACAGCLRERLDALSVGRWRLRDDSRIPWGKVSG